MSRKPTRDRGERQLIRRLQRLLTSETPASAAGVPFGDDMAALSSEDPRLLWTVDMLMDGVDFDSTRHAWAAIGRKALAVNLSDCAAMAAQPLAALCAVSLANTLTMKDAVQILRGAQKCAAAYGCAIVGGDTNSWDAPTVISISLAGHVPPDQTPVRRDGARSGDRIWVTGRIGGSILGRHLTFEPRIATALEINRRLGPHAMIDISDGLALDLARILEASGCGAVLDADRLDAAIHPDAERLAADDGQPARDHALHDGEDFELIAVLPQEAPASECEALGLLPIGRITAEDGLFLDTADGNLHPIPIRGWEHFR